MATEFSLNVIKTILKIPKGKVATYGQIAALAGKPGAARGVSWILHSSSKVHRLPWHRVVGSLGRISFPRGSRHYNEQRELLIKERIVFGERDHIELARFQWSRERSETAVDEGAKR